MTARRNRISSELMEALQMLKYTIKRGNPLNFTAGMNDEEQEKIILELLEASDGELDSKTLRVQQLLDAEI